MWFHGGRAVLFLVASVAFGLHAFPKEFWLGYFLLSSFFYSRLFIKRKTFYLCNEYMVHDKARLVFRMPCKLWLTQYS